MTGSCLISVKTCMIVFRKALRPSDLPPRKHYVRRIASRNGPVAAARLS